MFAILSFLPPIGMIAVVIGESVAELVGVRSEHVAEIADAFLILLFILAIVMMGLYFQRIRASEMEENRKAKWMLILLFGNVFVLPLLWYLFYVRWANESKVPGSN